MHRDNHAAIMLARQGQESCGSGNSRAKGGTRQYLSAVGHVEFLSGRSREVTEPASEPPSADPSEMPF